MAKDKEENARLEKSIENAIKLQQFFFQNKFQEENENSDKVTSRLKLSVRPFRGRLFHISVI